MYIKRRTVLSGLVGLSIPLIASSCTNSSNSTAENSASPATENPAAPAAGTTVRIGYQKATELDLLRSRGDLDKRLKDLDGAVEWALFPSGPPMLEAMNAGKIDFGGVGESPPIFSQAAGGQFYYIGYTLWSPKSQDILVLKDSPIQSPADFKGKKFVFQKGSSAHYLLLQTLAENNISPKDIETISLSPADARAAFEQRNVDAWSIWDPFLAVAQTDSNIRSLNVGRERRNFFLASQQFAQGQSATLAATLDELKQNSQWIKQNLSAVADQLSKDIKVDTATLAGVYKRRSWDILPVDAKVQSLQQQVADTFFKAQVIPKAVQVKDAFLAEADYAKVFPS